MFSWLAWYYIVFTSSGRTYKLLVVIWRDYYKMSQEFLSSRNFGKIFYSTPLTSTRNLEVTVCVLHKCACWWRQLLCAGLQQLMRTRTSKKFFLSRLTPDMESKLLFIMTKVRFGQQKRYQEWFQKQVINTVTTLNWWKLLFVTSCDLIPLFLVFINSREPVTALRLDSLHLHRLSSHQWDSLLRYYSALGSDWLAPYNLHSKTRDQLIITIILLFSVIFMILCLVDECRCF